MEEVLKSLRRPKRAKRILRVLGGDWQSSGGMACRSSQSVHEVSALMRRLEAVGYVESIEVSPNVKAWRLRENEKRRRRR